MITLKGKYNFANIFIDEIDDTTKTQIRKFLNHPAFGKTYIAIMPDCHKGEGSCIGFTMKMNDYIIPNIVGVDIGCGINTCNLGKIDIKYEELDKFIRKNIPYGFNVREHQITRGIIDKEGIGFVFAYDDIAKKIGLDSNRIRNSIGTLGGGNHFIEIDEDKEGNKWLTIHSGSRKFGNEVARYHQMVAKKLMDKMFLGDTYKTLEFLLRDSDEGKSYLNDMYLAQIYAEFNRRTMATIIVEDFFKKDIMKLETIESVHNYIDLENKIIRKGAISAKEGERCIIPFNMKDGIAICRGKGNKAYNYSAPHGAGRVMSRTKAREVVKLEEFKETMKDVWSSSINERTLDEAPMAYKDKDLIIKNITDTVDIEFFMKPVYNFKDDTKDKRKWKK